VRHIGKSGGLSETQSGRCEITGDQQVVLARFEQSCDSRTI
jgi:hypothetical protein